MNDLRMEHVGVAVKNMDAAIRSYQDIFGYRVVSGPFDDPVQKVTVCFLGWGEADEVQIELVAPLGDDSPVNRILGASGGGAYHVCYNTGDIDAALKEARAKGCMVIAAPVPAVAYGGRRIAWLYTPTRQLVELVERA